MAAEEYRIHKDFNGNQALNLRLHYNSGATGVDTSEAVIFYDSSSDLVNVRSNGSWKTLVYDGHTHTAGEVPNHDALNGFVSNEHINHTSVSISAGTGLSGGGTIATNRTISLSHLGLENLVDPNADRIMMWDDSAATTAWMTVGNGLKISLTTLSAKESEIDHNSLANYLVSQHRAINDASTSTTDLWSASKISTELSSKADTGHAHAANDITSGTFADARISQSSVTQHEGAITHDNLSGVAANEHIDHSLVSISAGDGLSGGGTIAASRTLSVDESYGFTWSATHEWSAPTPTLLLRDNDTAADAGLWRVRIVGSIFQLGTRLDNDTGGQLLFRSTRSGATLSDLQLLNNVVRMNSSGHLTADGRIDAVGGFRENGGATTGQYLRGNGTAFVGSTIPAGDLPSHTHTRSDISDWPLALSQGGTGANLSDPNADRLLMWDDSAGTSAWANAGAGLEFSGTTLQIKRMSGWSNPTCFSADRAFDADTADLAETKDVLATLIEDLITQGILLV